MVRNLLIAILVLVGSMRIAQAQTVAINTASGTSGNAYLGTSNYCVNECIYTEAEIGASNFTTAATAIQEIGFYVTTVGANTTFNNVNIYMKDVPLTTTTFTSGTYTTTGYTLVYSGSVSLPVAGLNTITLTTPYVRTSGTNLQVLVERMDNTTHTGYVYSCSNGNSTLGTGANTTRRYNAAAAPTGTTSLAVSAFRQSIQLKHILNNNLGVSNIYTLGRVPTLFNNVPAIEAHIYNDGVNTMTNVPVTLTMTGANSFTDVVLVTLAPNASQVVTFAPFTYANQGTTVLTVTLPTDDNTADNSKVWNQTVGQNLFSYKEPTQTNQPGGIGFTSGTGQVVAKFTLAAQGDLNEVKVDFATSGNPFQVVVFDASGTGGTPGTTPLWTSSSYTTVAGTAFVPVSPALTLPPGDFYVGVRQTGTTNFQFAYQTETPIRPNTFYYGALTSPAWTAFSGAQPFRFAIEAQFYIPQPPNCATAFSPADNSLTVDAATTTNLTWLSGGGGATDYDVYFGTTYPPPFVTNTTATSHPVTLAPSTTYYWHVLAKNANGSAVGCDTLQFKTICPVPVSLGSSNVMTNTADLQWTEPGTATQWQVEYGPSPLTLGSGTRSVTTSNPLSVSGLTQGTTYQFYVRSICAAGDTSAWSAAGSFTTSVSCLAPTAISFSNITSTSADVNWTPTGGVEILEYGPTGHIPGTGATAGVGGTLVVNAAPPYSLSGLSPSSGYDVFIRQDCSSSSNGFSTNLSAPLATTGAPSNDTVCGAYALTLNSTTPLWVNTTNATITATDPQDFVGCTGANNNVWYSFTTSSAGVYTITGYSSRVNTTSNLQNMSAWAYLYSASGTCPSLTLTLVGDLTACNAAQALPATNNVAPNVSRSIPTPSLAASTTYYLFLDGNSSSYGNIGITVAAPLAIKLEKILAANIGSSNKIEWNTLSEASGDWFELERSIDGKSFSRIYEQRANGEAGRYTYIDNDPARGINYYRLRMISADGAVAYSETVSALVKSNAFEVQAFPNPVSRELTVKVAGIQGADATIQVTDVTGKTLRTIKMKGYIATIDMNGLANGIYLIKYSDASRTQTIRINKQ